MQPYLTLVRRELTGYFNSFLGYVIIASFQLLLGLSFVLLLKSADGKPMDTPVTETFFMTGFFWLILLLGAPVITMRTFALEKFSGTFETLMTTPVSDVQVVLAKFTGSLVFYLLAWLPALAYPYLLRYNSINLPPIDPGTIVSTFLGIFLFGAFYLAMGCFASSLTRAQVVAAMITFALGLGLFLLSFLSVIVPATPGWQSKLYAHISMVDHMRDFTRGMVDTRFVVFYLSLTLIFLFLTLKVVESRRWK
ncbi:ABC transporter permease [Verrucomicrobiota bacterium]|nr:ABC transporter permease [Verrucomicrobiota bacterium]